MTTKSEMHIGEGLREYIVEYLSVTAKSHCFKGERVMAGSKMEAFNLCKRMTKTGRVLRVGDALSGLRVMTSVETLKSDRGCAVW